MHAHQRVSGVPGRKSVRLDVRVGAVVIRGPLSSSRAKWLCIECCRHVAGVINLVDEDVVEQPKKKIIDEQTPTLPVTT